MTRLRLLPTLLLPGVLGLAVAWLPVSSLIAQEEQPAKTSDRSTGRSRWQQIIDRDIFNPRPVKRTAKRRQTTTSQPVATPPAPTKPQLLLTGVSLQDAKLYALFEHRSSGRVAFVAAGDTLSEHQIVEVTVGRVVVGSPAGPQQTLKLGDHLEIDDQTLETSLEQIAAGREDSSSASSNGQRSSTSNGASTTGASATASSADRKALLERLRQRRREQLQGMEQQGDQPDAQENAQPDDQLDDQLDDQPDDQEDDQEDAQEESSDDAGSSD